MFNKLMRLLRRPAPVGPPPSSPDENLYRVLAENNSDVLCRIGPDLLIKYASPSAQRVFGWPTGELIGRYFHEFTPREDLALIAAAKERERVQGEAGQVTLRFRRKDGTMMWVEATGRPLLDPVTGIYDSVVSFRDATARYQLQQQLAAQAVTDGLTGLANRRAFDEAFDCEWRRTLRERSTMSVLLLDVDHFKKFNDTYGHQVGDDCLRAVAGAVRSVIHRPGDLAVRYGGEELALILSGTDAAGAAAVAELARQAVQALQIPHSGNTEGGGVVTVSIGAATAVGVDRLAIKMPDGLLSIADQALYRAKRGGRIRAESALVSAPGELAA
ncbi:MAG: diguanylate cyclase [Phycisphaerales bacterium]|nr:diguanylate cyclase [Phycisphaerales bacterium]